MAYRAKLFKSLAIGTMVVALFVIGATLVLVDNAMSTNNQLWVKIKATAESKLSTIRAKPALDTNDVTDIQVEQALIRTADSRIQTPALFNASIVSTDVMIGGIALAVALPIIILFLLLSWRNHVGLIAEQRHQEMMAVAKYRRKDAYHQT